MRFKPRSANQRLAVVGLAAVALVAPAVFLSPGDDSPLDTTPAVVARHPAEASPPATSGRAALDVAAAEPPEAPLVFSTAEAASEPPAAPSEAEAQEAFQTGLAMEDSGQATVAYQNGVAARDAGQYARAAALFGEVGASSSRLAPFARLREAQMLARDDRIDEAARRFEAVTEDLDLLPLSVQLIALREAADAFDETGRVNAALETLARIEGLDVSTFARAAALTERARLLREYGDAGWVEVARLAMATEPGSAAAVTALDMLDRGGHWYPPLTAAYAEYRARRNEASEQRYLALIEGGALTLEEAAVAWFYLGALAERKDEPRLALTRYATSIFLQPAGGLADDSRYWRGRVMEELERVRDAAHEYDLLVAEYPDSAFVDDARLRAAVALGFAGFGGEATARLAAIADSAGPRTAAYAARWHEVLVTRFGAPPAGSLSPAAADPTSHVAAFEHSGDAVVDAIPGWALDERPQPVAADKQALDDWLTATFGQPPAPPLSVLADIDVLVGAALAAAGETDVARALFLDEFRSRRDEPHALVELAYEAQRHGLHDVAMSSANAVLAELSPSARVAAPRSLLATAYPVPFLPDAQRAADEFGIPVLLLYALVRQESAFNSAAGSSAGAFGLTQVIEETGSAIARALRDPSWTFEDLARPDVALRFGAYYLAEQLRKYDGHMMAALSAYNAGPGNASRWLRAQTFPGPDGYVYAIDFSETRLYMETVVANYAMYRYIYAGTPYPALPHGG